HRDAVIDWRPGHLPALAEVGGRFDLILLNAVWMHVPPAARAAAFDRLVNLLAPGGLLVITVRYGPDLPGRTFFPVPADELAGFAQRYALGVVADEASPDRLGRDDVHWRTVAIRAGHDPDGGLALLRQVIVHDAKSSTYKLALLRSVLRIADGQRGLVQPLPDGDVLVPMGAVALNWLRQFRPLLFTDRPYKQATGGSAMRQPVFQVLGGLAADELRPGARFEAGWAGPVDAALRAARALILKNPVTYTTGPDGTPLFRGEGRPERFTGAALALHPGALWMYGRLRVPGALWRAMTEHAAWVEPALELEWSRLMQAYDPALTLDECARLLAWADPERSTQAVRALVQTSPAPVPCVWTGRPLTDDFQVDHCVPFARWPNNDLWNLLPASKAANQAKRDRLPSADLLQAARPRIEAWWTQAYLSAPGRRGQFLAEAAGALPVLGDPERPGAVFAGLTALRHRLRAAHQLAEWAP
ncbi:MAG: hypothetical protein KC613_28230, partial [Myxococcales bacterium]|nr:hypothetical protein [Myxococcales bacterium]